jgi:hypothetical protein
MRRLNTFLALTLMAVMAFSLPLLGGEKEPSETKEPAKETTPAPAPEVAAKPAAPAAGPLQIKVGDATIKFGLLVQPQADFQQNASGGYAQNLMLRRTRFLVGGQVTKTVFFFFETENSRLGNSNPSGTGTKNIATGFQTLDAAVEWRPKKSFNVMGGLIRVPTSREAMESSSNEFTIDFNTYAFTASTAMGSTGGNRDTGLNVRGYFFDDRLEYRAAVVAGMRDNTHVTHPLRYVGRLQYNFFDTEVYGFPSYAGANFGKKKILALGAAYDKQMTYEGFTTDLFADIPTSFGSALGTVTFQQLDGAKTSPVVLAKSNIVTVEGGLYFKSLKVGSWARYEQRNFDVVKNRDERKYLVGLNYYPMGNNFNIKAAVARVKPPTGPETTQLILQMQVFYF